MALAGGQHLLVAEDRPEPVVAGHVGRGENPRDPRDLQGLGHVDRDDPRMGQRAADELHHQLVAGGRDVVEIDRLPGHVRRDDSWGIGRPIERSSAGSGSAGIGRVPIGSDPAWPFAWQPSSAVSPSSSLRSAPIASLIEFQQDILGDLEAEVAGAADVRDRLDLGPGKPARLAESRLGERPPGQERLGPGQSAGGRADARVRDRGRGDRLAVPARSGRPRGRSRRPSPSAWRSCTA